MEFIDELETVYCDAHDEISKSIIALQNGGGQVIETAK
jgi:hypothetical protein